MLSFISNATGNYQQSFNPNDIIDAEENIPTIDNPFEVDIEDIVE